jgi:hypothetical protein
MTSGSKQEQTRISPGLMEAVNFLLLIVLLNQIRI